MEVVITEKKPVTIRTETEEMTERIFWFSNDSIVEMRLWWYN